MLRWKNKITSPNGGYRYFQKETNTMIEGPHWNGLVTYVYQHRVANGIAIEPGWEIELEQYMCEQVPDGCVDKPDESKGGITAEMVATFTAILGESILKGNPRVDQEEATRRAGICINCPSNVKPEGCEGCGVARIKDLIAKLAGGQTIHDNNLESCKHCGCLNRAQIWFPLGMLQKHTSNRVMSELPANCWKKK